MNSSLNRRMAVPAWAALALKIPRLNEQFLALLFQRPHGKLRPEEKVPPKTPGREVVFWGKERISAQVYGEGSRVLLVHGWAGNGLQMSAFVDPLVERGHQVVVVDLPAHGKTGGRLTNVLECADALLLAERRFGSFEAVIAHSWGAAVVAVAQQRGLNLGAATFIAPLPSLEMGMREFSRRAEVDLDLLERATVRIEKKTRLNREAMNLRLVGARLRTPLLLIHDHDDHRTPIDESRMLAQAWPGARMMETHGLGHRRILRDFAVVQRAVAFVDQVQDGRTTELESVFPAPESQAKAG